MLKKRQIQETPKDASTQILTKQDLGVFQTTRTALRWLLSTTQPNYARITVSEVRLTWLGFLLFRLQPTPQSPPNAAAQAEMLDGIQLPLNFLKERNFFVQIWSRMKNSWQCLQLQQISEALNWRHLQSLQQPVKRSSTTFCFLTTPFIQSFFPPSWKTSQCNFNFLLLFLGPSHPQSMATIWNICFS